MPAPAAVLSILCAIAGAGPDMPATIGVHVEQAIELPLSTALELARALGEAVRERTGAVPSFLDDDPGAARTKNDELLVLRLFAGPTLLRLVAERRPSRVVAEIDLPRPPETWSPILQKLAARLFPDALPRIGEVMAPPVRTPGDVYVGPPTLHDAPPTIAPWILIGAGAASAAAGVALALSGASDRHRAETGVHLDRDFEALADRAESKGLASTILIGAGVTTLALGVAFFAVLP